MNDNPSLDKRSAEDIVAQAKALVSSYTLEWTQEGELGLALFYLFSRLMEVLIDRLNQVPEKNFLAFLDVSGVVPLPPRAAKAPVRFILADGAENDGFVPQGTQLATSLPPEQEPLTFETEKHLIVSRSQLKMLFSHDPIDDRYTNLGEGGNDVLTANENNESKEFAAFVGTDLIPHKLCMVQNELFNINHPTQLTLIFTLNEVTDTYISFFENDEQKELAWKIGPIDQPHDISPTRMELDNNKISVVFEGVSNIVTTTINQVEALWLWAETIEPLLPAQASLAIKSIKVSTEAIGIQPELAFFNATPIDNARDFHPFGEQPKISDTFFLAGHEAFSREGSRIKILFDFHAGDPGPDPDDIIELEWEFWDGGQWKLLGKINASGVATPPQGKYAFLDYTDAFTSDQEGEILYDRYEEETLSVFALSENVTLDVAHDGNDTFQLTVKLEMEEVEVFDKLTMAIVESEINRKSKYIIVVRNLESETSPPDNRPQEQNNTVISEHYPRIEFDCPKIEKREVNGEENYWIRACIINGNYGEEAKLTLTAEGEETPAEERTLSDWIYTEDSFEPPIIHTLNISYAYSEDNAKPLTSCLTYNNFSYNTCEELTTGDSFSPFIRSPETEPALYLGFDRPFSNRAVSLYVAVKALEQAEQEPRVVWEYWNGALWKNLGVHDETRNLTESGMVEFTGPIDFKPTNIFGKDCYWSRARLEQGAKSTFTLLGIYPNTTWTKNCVTITDEIMGSSPERPDATFTLSHAPVLEGQRIEVREPERPGKEELETLIDEEGADAISPVTDGESESREYWVRWHEVDHFRLSGTKSRHYTIDRSTGRITFGDGVHGMIPLAGRNNIRAVFYQTGGGEDGNAIPRNAVTALKRSIPFIDSAYNVEAAGGGSDAEKPDHITERGPQAIKHRDRAVTWEDYEWLAKDASLQVARAKCLPATNADNAGRSTLILVPHSADPEPLPTQGLIREVKGFLKTRRIATANLDIVGPTYTNVSVQATIYPQHSEEADHVRNLVKTNLEAFFHPLTGGPDEQGWEFGRDVYVSEVCKVIEDTAGVNHAEDVRVSGGTQYGEYVEVGEDSLVASGEHQVAIADESAEAGVLPAQPQFLGNTNSKELHDLQNVQPNCQVDEILPERRKYFASIDEALAEGYDLCAWCFGPDQSTR
jgi:hypothetical protein